MESNELRIFIAVAQEGITSLAVDETSVYWTRCRYEPEKHAHGTVMKAPKCLPMSSSNAPFSLPSHRICRTVFTVWPVSMAASGRGRHSSSRIFIQAAAFASNDLASSRPRIACALVTVGK